jgi:nucleotide-binding universal stress UspA family protein
METILVPLDGSTFGEHALPVALALARRGRLGLALAHVHHIAAAYPSAAAGGAPLFAPGVDLLIREQEEAYLADVADRIRARWDGPVSHALLDAPVADALCRHAVEIDAAVIVLCTHGRGGMARAWLGSVADRLLRQSPVPILVVHPATGAPDLDHEPRLRHLLVPLDGSSLAEQALDPAVWLGRLTGAHLTLLRVVEPVVRGFYVDGTQPSVDVEAEEAAWRYAADYLADVAQRLREQGVTVATEAVVGRPAAAILEAAGRDAIDLIAMATHGHGMTARMLVGSVADKLIRGAQMPLFVTRPHNR